MSATIPIQNIYYLLCYAWDELPESGLVDVDTAALDKPSDLLAKVLINGTKHVIRRGLEQGYELREEALSTIRGRIKVADSARRFLLQQGRALCEYDELSVSTLPNQILKASLRRIAGSSDVAKDLRHDAGLLVRQLRDVEDIKLSRQVFRKVQLHGNNRYYRFLLHVCSLLMEQALMDERSGSYRFRDFVRDERAMARLFEKFLLNFYRKEQSTYQVKKERIYWQASSSDDPGLSMLPTMETDISLRSSEKTLIIDAKYYSRTLQSYYGSDSVHSSNLYQIFSYLKNIALRGGNDAEAEGVLLYPVVDRAISKSYQLHDHTIRIETVDLREDWQSISRRLLNIANL
jgi:5-methylcytosine-specific restriction enzyme subunit McrC